MSWNSRYASDVKSLVKVMSDPAKKDTAKLYVQHPVSTLVAPTVGLAKEKIKDVAAKIHNKKEKAPTPVPAASTTTDQVSPATQPGQFSDITSTVGSDDDNDTDSTSSDI